jgi:TolB-like protein
MSASADEVRRQLDRLLASAVFANAGRMSRFLKFVVDKSLAGQAERLKEYVIGVEVFDRDASYDPRLDSIVRVEAARLRSKLAEYYAGEGRDDAVVLSLPKGGYAPIVTRADRRPAVDGASAANGAASTAIDSVRPLRPPRSARHRWALAGLLAVGAAAAAVVAWTQGEAPVRGLRVAVLPFSSGADPDGDAFALRFTEGVTAELVRTGRFSVVASSAARAEHSPARRPREVAAALDADVLVGARLRSDGEHVRVEAYAVGGELEEKLWVDGFEGTVAEADALEHDIAAAIADALGTAGIAAGR